MSATFRTLPALLAAMLLAACIPSDKKADSSPADPTASAPAQEQDTDTPAADNGTAADGSTAAADQDQQQGSSTGPAAVEYWTKIFDGYGSVRQDADGTVYLAPAAVGSADTTRAALAAYKDEIPENTRFVRIETVATTEQQLRQNSVPNPWETAWLLFNFNDAPDTATNAEDDNNDYTFYAVALKTNGIEVSKQDAAYPGGQSFIATDSNPVFEVGRSYHVRVDLEIGSGSIQGKVYIDGVFAIGFTDTDNPYLSGRIAAYTEDAAVRFAQTSLQISASAFD